MATQTATTEPGVLRHGVEEEESSGSSDEEEESGSGSSEEEEEEEDEPILKYRRFAKEVVNSLHQSTGEGGEPKNVIVSMAVHPKFIALGTYDGMVKLLDHSGTLLKDREYHLHRAQINQISVDEEGDVMASCSDDGKVAIIGLFTTKVNNTVQFEKPVKSIAIHPHFGKTASKTFVVGLDRLLLVEERRWPLIGYKTSELQFNYGIINVIKWRDNYIAWANDKSVYVYDIVMKDYITCIKFEEESPTVFPCSLCWVKSGSLLVGRGHLVKLAEIKETEQYEELTEYSGGIEPLPKKKKKMAIVAQNTFPEFLVCGVVPIFDNSDWNMVVLGYDAYINQEQVIHRGGVPPPHLIVVPPGRYSPQDEEFKTMPEVARDKLLPRGYSYCRCTEYHLEQVMNGNENRFYVLTPIDIILAQKTDANDHIDWLIRKKQFKEAMEFAEDPANTKLLQPTKLKETGIQFIYHLLKVHKYNEAARKCSDVLGVNDTQRWEDLIYHFIDKGVLSIILPFIPKRKPQLSKAIYEMVLNYFLINDTQELYKIIQDWPTDLYDSNVIMNAITEKLKNEQDNRDLLKVKAKLFEDNSEPDKALAIYLRLGDTEVFDLIRKKNLYIALIDHIEYLMTLGDKELNETVELLVEFRQDGSLPPSKVVKKLESFKPETNWEYYLHCYLDKLFDKDPKAGSEYHERQVQLYADYNKKKLLPFLRACNDIPLQKALDICSSRNLYEAMVFLLDRMGNPVAALDIIVRKLHDVDKAIAFVRENDDEELWDNLIKLSKQYPNFITGLLRNAGTHIDPTKLIKEIPNELRINDLGTSLVKLLNDYQLQVNLREGCRKILVKDSHNLMEKLHKLHSKATVFGNEKGITCLNCSGDVSMDTRTDYLIVFFCGHIYHENCVSHKNELEICHICYRSSTKNSTQPLKPS